MKKVSLLSICFLLSTLATFAQANIICTSNKALELIVQEIVGTRLRVSSVMKDGKQIGNAKNLSEAAKVYVYTSDATANIKVKVKINASELLGKDALGANDSVQSKSSNPYFWLDPLSVKLVATRLSDTLQRVFPDYAEDIKINTESFSNKLDLIYKQSLKLLPNSNGKRIILLSKGLEYFANRYGIEILANLNRNAEFKTEGSKLIESTLAKMDGEMIKIVGLETNVLPIDKEISFALKTNLFYLDIYGKDNQKKYSDFFLNLVRRMQRITN